jgi:hypothetical protein
VTSECPYHPYPKHSECHHIGDDFVTVYRDDHSGAMFTTYGHLSRRGSMTTWATPDNIDWQIKIMRQRVGGAALEGDEA